MKLSRAFGSFTAVSVFALVASCSSKSDDQKNTSGAGGNTDTGGTANSGGSSGGGTAGANGGKGGTSGNGGGKSDAGATGGADGGSPPDSGAGGQPATCPDKNLQTDPENCGSCGKSCAGGDCSDGLCVPVLVMDVKQPPYGFERSGSVGPSKVYFWEKTTADSNHYKLLVAPSTPGNPVATGDPPLQDSPFPPDIGAVTFTATSIYETIQATTVGGKGKVAQKSLLTASAPTDLFTLPAGPNRPASDGGGPTDLLFENIAIGDGAIFVTGKTQLNSGFNPVVDTVKIYRIGTPVTDKTTEPTVIVSGIGEVVTDLSVFGNATAGEHLFWLDYLAARPDSDAGYGSDYFVYTAPSAGGAPVLLGDANTSESAFGSDGTYVYWTEHNDAGRLMRVPLANLDMAHVTVVSEASNALEGLVVEGQFAYFMESADPGPIYRVNTSTGVREPLGNRTIGASVKASYLFGADSGFLYLSSIDGPVYRLPKNP